MNKEEILNQITELSKEWYILIGGDHHKDRDCHFYINTVWSYGQQQKYRVEHFGYLYREVEETFDTYKEAADYLLNTLKLMIEREKSIDKSDE
jgi:hypothetical protein